MNPRSGASAAKSTARDLLRARRKARSPAQRTADADLLAARAGALPELTDARTVAAYLSAGAEPGTGPLLELLLARGVEVLVPVLLPDGSLDWAGFDGRTALTTGRLRLREPVGPRHGRDAVRRADALVVPALACDPAGNRLGRGGGSFDRALALVAATVPVVALVYDDEVLPEVPVEPHDRRVSVIVTPGRTLRAARPGALDSGPPLTQD